MKKYCLKTKDGEIFNTTTAYYLEEAIEYFSKIKVLSNDKLLKLYTVDVLN
jgi:hypothetical protein